MTEKMRNCVSLGEIQARLLQKIEQGKELRMKMRCWRNKLQVSEKG